MPAARPSQAAAGNVIAALVASGLQPGAFVVDADGSFRMDVAGAATPSTEAIAEEKQVRDRKSKKWGERRLEFTGLLKDKTAAGIVRWRVRIEGDRNKKIRIPVGPGQPGFDEHYAAARRGDKLETKKPDRPKTGTLDELCDRYLMWLEEQVKVGTSLTRPFRAGGLA